MWLGYVGIFTNEGIVKSHKSSAALGGQCITTFCHCIDQIKINVDLVPIDFFLFPEIKFSLKKLPFDTGDTAIFEVEQWFKIKNTVLKNNLLKIKDR